MVDPKSTFSKILSDLEREIKDKHDLEIAKNKLLEASMMFIDITNRVAQSNSQYDILSNKIDAMQKSLRKIEEDIYIDENEDNEESEYNLGDQMHDNDINVDEFEFEIKCPYCNYEFVIRYVDNKFLIRHINEMEEVKIQKNEQFEQNNQKLELQRQTELINAQKNQHI